MKRTFKVATIFNIPIEINYSWFIIVGLVIFTLASGYFPATNPGLLPVAYLLMAIISALLLFASLLAHELAHSLVAEKHDLPIHGITLFVFGGVAQLEKEPATPAVEFKMAAAGPAMSFFLAVVFFSLTQTFFSLHFPAYVVSIVNYLFIINLVVGIFNLFPGFPLDGGRLLRAAIWHFTRDLKRATGIASAFGKIFAYLLIAYGLFNLFMGVVISGIWLIFIGFFLQEAADTSYRQVVMKKLLGGVRVAHLMTKNVVTVPANLPLEKLLDDYFFRLRFTSFPVVEDDTLLGLVTIHSVKEYQQDNWQQFTVRQVMSPITTGIVINEEASVIEALAKMSASGFGRLLVVKENKLIGILSQRDIMRLFEFKSEVSR
ncbi:MAG: site-2 protease family protein [Candidatus Margulisbacteria bacterium]|nr:site-2 protease family protein [Candidatus Margulisiibacteriota bacterium]